MPHEIHAVLADTYEQRLKAARHLIVSDFITGAIRHFRLADGSYLEDPITDEQRAEFIAFVAHTIGYDLPVTFLGPGNNWLKLIDAARRAADSSSSPAHPEPEVDH